MNECGFLLNLLEEMRLMAQTPVFYVKPLSIDAVIKNRNTRFYYMYSGTHIYIIIVLFLYILYKTTKQKVIKLTQPENSSSFLCPSEMDFFFRRYTPGKEYFDPS